MILRLVRRLVRIPSIFFWASYHGLYSFFFIVPRKDRIRLMARQTKSWGRGLVTLFGMELHIHGDTEEYARRGGLVVSNHLGYLDVFVHAAAFGLRFTPKKEIRSWPILGWYVALAQPVWIDRTSPRKSRDTLEEFRSTLRMNVPLIVYPEGTSTSGRDGLLPFKSTSFETVAGTSIPVQPVLIFYRRENPADTDPAWYGDVEFLPHLGNILGNGKVICDLYLLPPYYAPEGADRKQITKEVHDIMESEYKKILPSIEAMEQKQ